MWLKTAGDGLGTRQHDPCMHNYIHCLCLSCCSMETMDKANSRFRIGMMVAMMVFCAVGSAVAIARGKRDAKSHINTVYQQNKDRYAKDKNK